MAADRVGRPRAALPVSPSVVWTRRLTLLAVGLALVLMHHVVGAHQHTPSEPDPSVTVGVAMAPMPVHGSGPASSDAPGSPYTPAAALHVHHQEGGHDMAAMLHDCLAVLAAAAALALVLWLLRGGITLAPVGSRPGAATVRPGRSRPAAPVPVLLAQLQVLRL